ncbi:hypothetical protein ACUODF_49265, partial [Escherichia coli]
QPLIKPWHLLADDVVFFLPMYGVLLNMLLKRLADKSEINALQAS